MICGSVFTVYQQLNGKQYFYDPGCLQYTCINIYIIYGFLYNLLGPILFVVPYTTPLQVYGRLKFKNKCHFLKIRQWKKKNSILIKFRAAVLSFGGNVSQNCSMISIHYKRLKNQNIKYWAFTFCPVLKLVGLHISIM